MITMKTSLAGTDIDGNPFSVGPGEQVTLDEKSETNLINAGMAEAVKKPGRPKNESNTPV